MRSDSTPAVPLPDATGMRVAVVVSRFNDGVTGALRQGALDALAAAGAADRVEVFEVPGAFELPLGAKLAATTGRFDAVVCLGCVIRGETPHFDYICSSVAHAIAQLAVGSGVPVTFGVLTTDTVAQAMARARPGPSNKGWEAAAAALEMVQLSRHLAAGRVPAPGRR